MNSPKRGRSFKYDGFGIEPQACLIECSSKQRPRRLVLPIDVASPPINFCGNVSTIRHQNHVSTSLSPLSAPKFKHNPDYISSKKEISTFGVKLPSYVSPGKFFATDSYYCDTSYTDGESSLCSSSNNSVSSIRALCSTQFQQKEKEFTRPASGLSNHGSASFHRRNVDSHISSASKSIPSGLVLSNSPAPASYSTDNTLTQFNKKLVSANSFTGNTGFNLSSGHPRTNVVESSQIVVSNNCKAIDHNSERSRRPFAKLSLPLRTGSEPPMGRRRLVPAPMSIDLPCTPSPSPSNSNFSPEDIDRRYEEMLQNSGRLGLDSGPVVFAKREDVKFEYELGQGICGVVSKATHIPSGRSLAVKVMRRIGNSPEEHRRVIMDLDVVTKCHDCRHIVKCFGIFIFPSEVWICMELMTTCLDRLLKQVGSLPEHILGKVLIPILRALHYLKERHNIIHRDVKPSNFLLNEAGKVKLCDFGIAGLLENSRAKTRTAGCTAYLSPERITLSGPYDIRSDIWSLGVSLVELATGRHPLKDCATEMEMLTRIVDEAAPTLPRYLSCSDHFRDFVAKCLTKDVNYRPKYIRLLNHDFVRYHEQTQTNLAEWLNEVRLSVTETASIGQSATSSATVQQSLQQPTTSRRRLSAGSSCSSSGYGSVDTNSPSSQNSRSPGATSSSGGAPPTPGSATNSTSSSVGGGL